MKFAAGLIALTLLAGTPVQDSQRIADLERKVAELERRLGSLEASLNGVSIAKVGGQSITKHHLMLAKDLEAIRSGGGLTESAILVGILERASHEEILRRYGIRITGEEIVAERTRLDRETPPALAPRIHALLDPYPGMYDMLVVLPVLASAKARSVFTSDKKIQEAVLQQAEALIKAAQADPLAISKMGKERPGDYERIDSRTAKKEKHDWVKKFEDDHLKGVRDGQVKPSVVDLPDGYYVVRLIDSGKHSCHIEYVIFRKGQFDPWWREQLKAIDLDVTDAGLKEDLRLRPAGHPLVDRLFNR